jgi:hypothetical protein
MGARSAGRADVSRRPYSPAFTQGKGSCEPERGHASGALDDLSHGDRVECGCATGVLLDVLRGSAGGVLGLKTMVPLP